MWHLSTKWRVAVDRALNRFGLTHAHYLVLGSLSEFFRGGAKPSQRKLADFAGLEVMYVSKLVRPLEHAGCCGERITPGRSARRSSPDCSNERTSFETVHDLESSEVSKFPLARLCPST